MTPVTTLLEDLSWLAGLEATKNRLKTAASDQTRIKMEIQSVRDRLPAAILQRYDGSLAHKGPWIAWGTNGACSACHAPLSQERAHDCRSSVPVLRICDQCGVLLLASSRGVPFEPGQKQPQ